MIYKIHLTLEHTAVKELLDDVLPDVSEVVHDALAENENPVFSYQNEDGFTIAGLCFFPKWEKSVSKENPEIKNYHTTGIIVAVALWKRGETCEDGGMEQLHFAGYGSLDELVRNIRGNNTTLLANRTITLNIDDPTKYYQGNDYVKMAHQVREFDFVFLEYSRYLRLATGTDYYPPGYVRTQEAIIIERSVISYDFELDFEEDNSNGVEVQKVQQGCVTFTKESAAQTISYRSLYFRPAPAPELASTITRAAIAFEDGRRCPPYWVNAEFEDDTSCEALKRDLGSVICQEMKEAQVVTKTVVIYTGKVPCIGVNVGTGTPIGSNNKYY